MAALRESPGAFIAEVDSEAARKVTSSYVDEVRVGIPPKRMRRFQMKLTTKEKDVNDVSVTPAAIVSTFAIEL